jgi:hypothetical protein
MMKTRLIIVGIALIILVLDIRDVYAQQESVDTQTYVLLLNDGGEIMGKILSQDEWAYRVETVQQGIMLVPRYAVKEKIIAGKRDITETAYFTPNPHPTRYFYSPTAIPLKKGEGYIQTIYFVSAQIQYGFTDHFSAGIATTALGAPILVSMKYGGRVTETVSLAAGIQAGHMSWAYPSFVLGVGFGTATFGTDENNLSVSGGYGALKYRDESYFLDNPNPPFNSYTVDTTFLKSAPMFSLSGNVRISKKASLFGEFWFIPTESTFFGGPGMRFYPGRKICWDFIMSTVIAPGSDFFVIPGISATWKI